MRCDARSESCAPVGKPANADVPGLSFRFFVFRLQLCQKLLTIRALPQSGEVLVLLDVAAFLKPLATARLSKVRAAQRICLTCNAFTPILANALQSPHTQMAPRTVRLLFA